ncbi:MAG TPA: hypothetical protein VFU55_05490 [Terracidiphilus sp.]|nr:hypothetical protein [Terracidiphilus sp.]
MRFPGRKESIPSVNAGGGEDDGEEEANGSAKLSASFLWKRKIKKGGGGVGPPAISFQPSAISLIVADWVHGFSFDSSIVQ